MLLNEEFGEKIPKAYLLVNKIEADLKDYAVDKAHMKSKEYLKFQIFKYISEEYVNPGLNKEPKSFGEMEQMFEKIINDIPYKEF